MEKESKVCASSFQAMYVMCSSIIFSLFFWLRLTRIHITEQPFGACARGEKMTLSFGWYFMCSALPDGVDCLCHPGQGAILSCPRVFGPVKILPVDG